MKSRIITLLVALLCLPLVGRGQSVWDGTADVSWYNESQTEFTITTAEQLAGLAKLVNERSFVDQTIKLGADIILNENSANYENWETAAPTNKWTPIGNAVNKEFHGTFDGCGYTISGLYINNEEGAYCGLFGLVTGGNITNIKVINSYITAANVGGIVGNIKSEGTISKCSYSGIIVGKV